MDFDLSSLSFRSQENTNSVDTVESVEGELANGSFGEQSHSCTAPSTTQGNLTQNVTVQFGDRCPWCTVGTIIEKRQSRNRSVTFFACDKFDAGHGCKFHQSKPYASRSSSKTPRRTYITAPATTPRCMLSL